MDNESGWFMGRDKESGKGISEYEVERLV